jgi:LAGLIDADG endonuclease
MCSVCETNPAREYPADTLEAPFGAVAQLVEHLHGMQGVVGSSPISSTDPFGIIQRWWRSVGFTLAGVVAGEGTFTVGPRGGSFADGSPRLRFRFVIEMAARDRRLLEAFETFLGVGSIQERCDRRSWLPTCSYSVSSHRAHRLATIPFAEAFLLPCSKRTQFESWRAALDAYEHAHPTRWGKGPSPCSVPGCEKPVRGRSLCRSHYYRATGY